MGEWQRGSGNSGRPTSSQHPYSRVYPDFTPTPQSRSMPMLSEDFISGFMEDGSMSVVRRFFCLFVTFDLVFIALLWLISVAVTGESVKKAFVEQVIHYSVYTSLFDIVMASICRFVILILFYAVIYLDHWIVIALSTSGSCAFLIFKVFIFDWPNQQQQVFQVLIILVSFTLAWGEAWFLDCRVIPQERYARNYYLSSTGPMINSNSMLNPFLQSLATESVANFYSPYESIHNSDDEDDKEDEYKLMGIECVKKAYNLLLESANWKVEKVTNKGDTIKATCKDRIGKIFKLTGKIEYPSKLLLKELFYNIEQMPSWNPTLLESRIVRKIDNHTDITYQATTPAGGGVIKSRDFVNLRCWQLFVNGRVLENYDVNTDTLSPIVEEDSESDSLKSSEENGWQVGDMSGQTSSSLRLESERLHDAAFVSLSRSLGAKNFGSAGSVTSIEGETKKNQTIDNRSKPSEPSDDERVYITSAVSIDYSSVTVNTKFIRAQNTISCFAFREIHGRSDACIFEWLLCLDLKGYIPKYVLDSSYTAFMQDYMTYLRKRVADLSAAGDL